MIDSADLLGAIADRGPWLYHATLPANVASILRGGLIPGSERNVATSTGFHLPRAGRVYLGTIDDAQMLARDYGWTARFAVDLRRLDPARMDPDEDLVSLSHLRLGSWSDDDPPWVHLHPPFFTGEGWQPGPNGEGTLAHWADTTPGFDASAVTAKSLRRGRIAYRGSVPPDALIREA